MPKRWLNEVYRINELTSWDDDLEHYDMSPDAFLAEGLKNVLRQISSETRVRPRNLVMTVMNLDEELYMVTAGKARYFLRRLH